MSPQTSSTATPMQLLGMAQGLVIHQALYAAAKLGVADLLKDGPQTSSSLAGNLKVNESAFYRILRLLASQSVFEEKSPRTFANTELSHFLRSGVPGSVRAILVFRGSGFFFNPFSEILYSVETGLAARAKLYGMEAFEYLKTNPETARVFDDAMTSMSELLAPAVAVAYDFGRWESLMDVGGGNGMLLASILKAHPALRGVLADLPHTLERAEQRGFLGGELESRSTMQPCDFFDEVPSGCRAYLMKHVIHDWDDKRAQDILANCRRAIPSDGALLLVEWVLAEGNAPSAGKFMDVVMMLMTGGKERTLEEYRHLLRSAGFWLNREIRTPADLSIIEALPD
ncbi:MAG TPA: methyltransferase [Candidatus Sulfotelmatobacter sp.]|nr:methyltransferase [Candidatus Sulfotelmatobacter sp.]